MLKNYLKIAFRSMARYKFISFINLFGLTVGITCCLLILTYIIHETSYDKYNSKADRIYRVTRSFNNREGVVSLHLSSIAPPFGPLLKNEFPDIQAVTRTLNNGTTPTRYKDKIFNEKDVAFADDQLAGIFDIDFIQGNPQTALRDPNSIVLTADDAQKYFGSEDPMGKIVRIYNKIECKVTGIYKPFPKAAHWHPNMMISFSTLNDTTIYGEKQLRTNWGNNAFYTYILLPKNYPAKNIEARFPRFLDKYMDKDAHKYTKLYVQKLTDIHLTSHLDDEIEENGDINRIYVFSAIALFILLIACINYMNLSTARSTLRAREIGIRKVSGAQRGEIIAQFLSESVLITWMAAAAAIAITTFTLPWLNKLTGQEMAIADLNRPLIWVPLLIMPFFVGIIAGIYPAIFMSSFQPVKVLKGLFKAGSGSISLRKILVVAQFSISIILIICTAIVFQQLHYMQEKSLGFSKGQVVELNYDDDLTKNFEAFRNALRQNTQIAEISRSSRTPGGRLLDEAGASTESGDSLKPVNADIKYLAVDYDFVPTYGIQIAHGRNFSRNYATDSTGFLLNEAATKVLGVHSPAEMVGRNFKYGDTKGRIIGIVKDYHFESLHQPIVPMIMVVPSAADAQRFGKLSVRIAPGNPTAAIEHLEKTWKQFLPQHPIEYRFMDEKFDQLYRSERRQGSLFTTFSVIAIFIACLGLFGLSAFAITQRIKEIGIRKVLGASTGNIVRLLSMDFIKLVAIAALIAFPLAWLAMHSWLGDFAYRISIHWWVFLLAGILAAIVALATISIQAIKAAVSNPVKNLRSE